MTVQFIGGSLQGKWKVLIPPPEDYVFGPERYVRMKASVVYPGLVEEYVYLLAPRKVLPDRV